MKLIKHPSVIQLLEVLASPTTIYIVSENCSGGELFDRIIEQGCFTEDEARKYFRQLIEGIAQCHAHGVCHRVRRQRERERKRGRREEAAGAVATQLAGRTCLTFECVRRCSL